MEIPNYLSKQLDERRLYILEQREHAHRTYRSISEDLGISLERVYQLYRNALLIRHNTYLQRVCEHIDIDYEAEKKRCLLVNRDIYDRTKQLELLYRNILDSD